jgi:hypothetical protein
MIRFFAALVIGLFSWLNVCLAGSSCVVNAANEIEYLVIWGPYPGDAPDPLDRIGPLAAKIGTTGDGKTRQLAFGPGIPFWVRDEPGIRQAIRRAFDTARQTNVAAHFLVDDHIGWDERPDLWNWYDPTKPGYNPDNKRNVEWYDWVGTANKRRYMTPSGIPSQSPHMCYNSPAIEKEIHRIVSQVVGPALREEIDKLKLENKEYLFAGITVGAEPGFDDYTTIPKLYRILPGLPEPMQSQERMTLDQASKLMDEDKAPYARLGYCSLTNDGYSSNSPPADLNQALAHVNQKFIEFLDKQFVDIGIPCSRLYTHIAASAPQDDTNNAPISIAFNPYTRPGWTTYPTGILKNGFQPLYDELAKRGNPAWGGVEANAAMANPNAPTRAGWEEYLARHYNHGAKVVGINVGTTDQSLMSHLSKGAYGEEALAAYRKFLGGRELIEK